jgi:hypothetical protein
MWLKLSANQGQSAAIKELDGLNEPGVLTADQLAEAKRLLAEHTAAKFRAKNTGP